MIRYFLFKLFQLFCILCSNDILIVRIYIILNNTNPTKLRKVNSCDFEASAVYVPLVRPVMLLFNNIITICYGHFCGHQYTKLNTNNIKLFQLFCILCSNDILIVRIYIYTYTMYKKPPLGQRKSGLIRQVTS
jgi:hypothetical protein